MELSKQATEQLQREVEAAIAAQSGQAMPADISIGDICKNKDLILGFLNVLVGLLPGVLGQLAGKVLVTAAQTWFAKKCA